MNLSVQKLISFPLIMFWLLGLIWGSSFIYMKLASQSISAAQIVLLRVLFGLIPIALYAVLTGAVKVSHIRYSGHFLVMAVVGTIGYYYGFAKGTSFLSSGVAGALSGLTPILCFVLALVFLRNEKVNRYKALGIGCGFLGVFLIAGPTGSDISSANIQGALYNLMGSVSVGGAFVYAKKYVLPLNIPISAVITYQLGISLVILVLFVDLKGIGAIWNDLYIAAGVIFGLGVLGTGIAFIIYYYIIKRMGAVSASAVAYIPPVIAMAIGVFIVGEKITPTEYLGAGIIFLGLILLNKKYEHAEAIDPSLLPEND